LLLRKAPDVFRSGVATPGCLTSEYEERETWTAESLRAARHVRVGDASYWFFVMCGWTRLRRYTFQVNTIASVCASGWKIGGTSSNVVISRDQKFSSNLRV